MNIETKDKLISEVYRRYTNGEITLEQREELIGRVNDKYIKENTFDITISINNNLLDKLDIFKEQVYEKYANGEITLEQREELIKKFKDEYIIEKATREEYRMSSFKKKYNYNPKDKSIIIDGEKYYVDLDINNPIMKIKDIKGNVKSNIRKLSSSIEDKDPLITLDNVFFKLKNSGRRDSVLKHEVGHLKSNAKVDNGCIKPELVKINFDAFLNNEVKKEIKNHPDKSENELKEIMKKEYIKLGITPASYNFDEAQKQRQKVIKSARKYINAMYISKKDKNNTHTNYKEIEADRYAVDHSSESDFKKGLREYNKYNKNTKQIKKEINARNSIRALNDMNKKEKKLYNKLDKKDKKTMLKMKKQNMKNEGKIIEDLDKKTIDDERKHRNISATDDYNIRSKALKDDIIKQTYKKK